MKKTLTVNIGGVVFHIDSDAFQLLDNYLEEIKRFLKNSSNREEILADIENRIAELFKEKISAEKEVIILGDVQAVIEILGQPGEFGEEEATYQSASFKHSKRLFRDVDHRMIGGVCSGLGSYFNLDPTVVRIIFTAAILLSGASVVAYIILWIVVPPALTANEKQEMQGKPMDLSNIEESVKKEMKAVRNKLEDLSVQFRERFGK